MKYITTPKKKEGFFVIHSNRNGISFCGLVKNGIEVNDYAYYSALECKKCVFPKQDRKQRNNK